MTPTGLPIYHFFPNILLPNLIYVVDLQHPCSGLNPTDIPPSTFALALLNKPTRKHTEVTDNKTIRKPSNLIIFNSSVSFISYLQSITTCRILQFQRYSVVHVRAFNIYSASAVILWMKRHPASFTRTTLLISVLYRGRSIVLPK